MKKRIERLERKFLTRKVFCFLTVLGFLWFIVPLLYIGRYNHGAGDDYWFAFHVHCTWLNTHNLIEVIKTAFSKVVEFYKSWQGTYSSVFFFSISPMAFGEQYAHAVPYMMIGMTCISTMILMYAMLKKWMELDGYICLSAAMASCVMQCAFMYTPASGLYWYNGAVHYVFMQGFLNLTVGFALLSFERIFHSRGKNIWWRIELAICTGTAIIAAGGNFSTALLTAEILVLLGILAAKLWKIQRRKVYLWFAIPLLLGEAGFLVNVLAPGNAVRQANFQRGSIIGTIGRCFTYSFSQMVTWVNIYVVVILILLLPMFLKAVDNSKYSFHYPLLVTGVAYCLYASMFAPGFYALGEEPLSRNQNICKMFLLLCLVLLEAYWCGWLVHKVKVFRAIVPEYGKNVIRWTAVLFIALLTGIISFVRLDDVSKKATFVNYGAYRLIADGEGNLYWHEYLQRLQLYRNEEKVVYVQPYSNHPYPLWINSDTEMSYDDSGMLSGLVAHWYMKDAVYEVK